MIRLPTIEELNIGGDEYTKGDDYGPEACIIRAAEAAAKKFHRSLSESERRPRLHSTGRATPRDN